MIDNIIVMSEKRTRGRPKGSFAKPKCVGMLLKDLCAVLNPETRVPVDRNFAESLSQVNNLIKFEELPAKSESVRAGEKIDFVVE
jgi:hypothetical protein